MTDCKKCKYYHTDCDSKFRCRIDVEQLQEEVINEFGHWLAEEGFESSCHDIEHWIKEYIDLKEQKNE